MSYDNWLIGGLTPSHIRYISYDKDKRTFTFNCVAKKDELDGADPRTEIDIWLGLASDVIGNDSLRNGGSNLQVCNTELITITDGVLSWTGSLLKPKWKEDNWSDIAIEYDLIVKIETDGENGSFIYIGDFGSYPNIDYSRYTDSTDNDGVTDFGLGDELGEIRIVEPLLVKKVIVYGSARNLPAWIECNGERKDWEVSCEGKEGDNSGFQPLEWLFDIPVSIITLATSPNTLVLNNGCYLQYIKVIYA
jgi:hypothetical protein